MNQRPYQDERDWRAMLNLLVEGRAANNGTYYVHTGDVSWWLYYHDANSSFTEQIKLWEDGERLLGWVLFTPEENCFDLFVHPTLRGTAQAAEMHTWSETHLQAQGHKIVRQMFIAASDSVRRVFLESHGYHLADESVHLQKMYVTRRALNTPITNNGLPSGFSIRSCRGESELEARATAQYGAFQSKWEWGKYTARWRRFMRSPVYVPERDVVAVAPDGRMAAGAIHWIDAVNGVGYFEPVGTHPDFQRLGLGRAVLAESMRRLQAAGLRWASVCCDAADSRAVTFYQACGFEIVETLQRYQKDLVIE